MWKSPAKSPCFRRIRLVLCLLIALWGISKIIPMLQGYLIINISDSLPHGVYVRANQPLEIGNLVEFKPTPMAVDYAIRRWGENPERVRFLKPVVAGPGDVVSLSMSGDWLLVNGQPLVPILAHDSDGNPMPCYWKNNPSRVLRDHEILVISTHSPGSYDSRYFGPLNTADDTDLVVRRPLWLW